MKRLASFVVLLAVPSVAAPRDFPFTWTSHTSAAGQSSLEAWLTPRLQRTDDFFQLDTRLAWTHGVTRTVESQLSLDLDFQRTNLTQGVTPKVSSLWRWTTWRSGAPFAVGGLGRASVGLNVFEVEGRLFADLELGRVLMALNASGAGSVFWNGGSGVDTRLEESVATRYRVSEGVTAGFEVRARSSWARRIYQGTAVSVGPALTLSHPMFWVSLGAYTQVAAQKADDDRALAEPNTLRDDERFVVRLTFGFDAR